MPGFTSTSGPESNRSPVTSQESLLDQNPLPCWIYEISTLRFLWVNRAAVECYGYTKEQFLGMTLADIRPPEDVPSLLVNVPTQTAPVQNSGTWRHRRRDSSLLSVRVTSRGIRYKGVAARLAVISDIQNQVATEKALARSESLLRSVWENARDLMRITDAQGIVLRVNDAYARFAGMCREDLEQRPFWIIYPDDHQARSAERYRERFDSGALAGVAEHDVTLRNGRRYSIQLSNSPLQTEEGPCILTIWPSASKRTIACRRW